MATVGIHVGLQDCEQRATFAAESTTLKTPVSVDEDENQQQVNSLEDDTDPCTIQTKLFKRRKRASAALSGGLESSLPPKCCIRCKSDLNRKLMVRCATCLFRCHLYCFSPPLKQHPAFLIHRQQHLFPEDDPSNYPPIWKCEKCQGTSVVFKIHSKPASTNKKNVGFPDKSTDDSGSTGNMAGVLSPKTKRKLPKEIAESKRTLAAQPEMRTVPFDWYRFRSQKAEALRHQSHSGIDELVFYSRSYTLMKKTATIWREYVLRRRLCRFRHERENKVLQYPGAHLSIMRGPGCADENASEWLQKIADEDEDVCLDSISSGGFQPYSRRLHSVPSLWKGEPPSALMCWTTAERFDIAEVLKEMEEQVCLAHEDNDVVTLETIGPVATAIEQQVTKSKIHTVLDLYVAGRIIQRALARHYRCRQRAERAKRRRRAREEAKRRATARRSTTILSICIQCIIQLMKKLGQAKTKKAMLLILRDAAEESQVKNNVSSTDESAKGESGKMLDHEQLQQIALMRIRRFFVRRVHPYVKLKKEVMARRLQRWMKSKHLRQKWHGNVAAARHVHRDRASIRIQRSYRCHRRCRVQKQFQVMVQALIEKNALKILRRVLKRWLLSRLAKKEADRCAKLDVDMEQNSLDLSSLPNNQLDEILEKRGMELYQLSDFWNAASLLERLCQLKNGAISKELQQKLAYVHHMTWYSSYDPYNLSRAHELYCASLEVSASGKRLSLVDTSVLQDFAVVMMQMEHFSDSLRLFAKLIEFFARDPQFPLWLLLAAVQLQQRGEWEQSVEYLTYLQDIPPPPYLERDILILCAISYESLLLRASKTSVPKTSYAMYAKEAWRSALHQWNHEEFGMENVHVGHTSSSRQKWDLLTSLGLRAIGQGHYIIACRVYTYALEHGSPNLLGDSHSRYGRHCQESVQLAWYNLADAFQHVGHLELYLSALQQRQICVSRHGNEVDDDMLRSWRERAEHQACSFKSELNSVTVQEKLRQILND